MAEKFRMEDSRNESEVEKIIVKNICAWCGKDMGEKEVAYASGLDVNHTMCPECAKKMSEE